MMSSIDLQLHKFNFILGFLSRFFILMRRGKGGKVAVHYLSVVFTITSTVESVSLNSAS